VKQTMTPLLKSAPRASMLSTLMAVGVCLVSSGAAAQTFPNLPISPEQKSTARKVAEAGVPLSELAPNAPDTYTVKSGDTLWDISKMFLRGPWRWPELWGMNMEEIRNPHLIYPGQTLYLIKADGRARLSTRPGGGETTAGAGTGEDAPVSFSSASAVPASDAFRLSPHARYERIDEALFTLPPSAIEAFLTDPLIIEEDELERAPRIVAGPENRVMVSGGDRAYVRGPSGAPIRDDGTKSRTLRIFRNVTPLVDPITEELLGYEAKFLGKAALVRGESEEEVEGFAGFRSSLPVPATIDIVTTNAEVLIGDRLVPLPPTEFPVYAPHAPSKPVDARIVSIYGNSVVYASQNQVVVINKGQRDGLEPGHVLVIHKKGAVINDRTDSTFGEKIKIPDERNGLMMVFKTFNKLSYGLVLEITDTARVGDRLSSPR